MNKNLVGKIAFIAGLVLTIISYLFREIFVGGLRTTGTNSLMTISYFIMFMGFLIWLFDKLAS